MAKNKQLTKKQIQGLIGGFEKQETQAAKELEAADQVLGDWKLVQIGREKAEAAAKGGVMPRAQIFYLDNTEERVHLEYQRRRSVGRLGDIRRRIKKLRKALNLTPE